jgi:hypothetical protein
MRISVELIEDLGEASLGDRVPDARPKSLASEDMTAGELTGSHRQVHGPPIMSSEQAAQLLDSIPGALERTRQGREQAARGEGIPIAELAEAARAPGAVAAAWQDAVGALDDASDLIVLRDRTCRVLIPRFQRSDDGAPMPVLVEAWRELCTVVSPWTAASWCTAADPALDGLSPAAWLRGGGDAGRVQQLCARAVARLGQ